MDNLTGEFEQAVGSDWRVLEAGPNAWFDAPSLTAGAELVERIAPSIENAGTVDIDLRAHGVRVRLGGGSGALTDAQTALAREISKAAADLGLTADLAALQTMRLKIDAGDTAALRPFWRSISGYEADGNDRLADSLRRDPKIVLNQRDRPSTGRNRMHVDVVRTPEAVGEAKSAIGGEPYGIFHVTLADDEGNEVDLIPGDRLQERPETTDWQVLFGAMTLYPTASPVTASKFAAAVAALADDAGVSLLVDIRSDGVTLDRLRCCRVTQTPTVGWSLSRQPRH